MVHSPGLVESLWNQPPFLAIHTYRIRPWDFSYQLIMYLGWNCKREYAVSQVLHRGLTRFSA